MSALIQYRRACQPSLFDAFCASLAGELHVEDTALTATGVFELRGHGGLISLAVDRGRRFIAASWRTLLDGRPAHCETFFVTPATKSPFAGLRVCGVDDARAAPLVERWHGWLQAAKPATATEKLPSFTELACLLASQGQAVLTSGELVEQVASLESERDYLRQLLWEQTDELRRLQAELREARAFSFAGDIEPPPPAPAGPPTDLAVLPEWCAAHEDEIVVLPRARAGAKKSLYSDPQMIFTALELLAGPYRRFRHGEMTRTEFDLLLPQGMRLSGSVADSVAGEQGDAYFVSWGGRRRFLEDHLAKGGGRDERYCLRIYFFWDEASERAVVGSMPQHLKNSLA